MPLRSGSQTLPRDGLILFLWGLCLLQILTVRSGSPYEFLRPWTPEHAIVATAFLLTSAALLQARHPGLVYAHLLVVGFLLLLHPSRSLLGRDGALAAMATYTLLLMWLRTPWRAELKLLVSSLVLGFAVTEAAFTVIDHRTERPPTSLLDFGDLLGPCREGGCLKPDLDVRIVAERGEGRFVTNHLGFRNAEQVAPDWPKRARRIILMGDSFVAGYRTDQQDTLGAGLERVLSEGTPAVPAQVLIAQLPCPEAALHYIRRYAPELKPQVVVVGITLGNDLSQDWAFRSGVPEPVIAASLLPPDAFRRSLVAREALRLERNLRKWRLYRRLAREFRGDPIVSDYGDGPQQVHAFDAIHGLGFFYSRQPLALVEQAYRQLDDLVLGLHSAARGAGARLLVALFPQRFQVNDGDWRAAVLEYGLDPAAFDLDAPDRRILAACGRFGLECVDLASAFRADSAASYLPGGDMHWNAHGQAIAARALAGAIRGGQPGPSRP